MLCKMTLPFVSLDEILTSGHSDESYIERYVPVVLFIMLDKVVPPFGSVDVMLKCDHSNESY